MKLEYFNFKDFSNGDEYQKSDILDQELDNNVNENNITEDNIQNNDDPPQDDLIKLSKDEYKILLEENYQKAFEEGYNKANLEKLQNEEIEISKEKLKIEDQYNQVIEQISSEITKLNNQFNETKEDLSKKALMITKIAINKVFQNNISKNILANLEDVIIEQLNKISSEPEITIYVNSIILDAIKKKLTNIVNIIDYKNNLILKPDDNIDIHACNIKWQYGSFEYNANKLVNEIVEIIS